MPFCLYYETPFTNIRKFLLLCSFEFPFQGKNVVEDETAVFDLGVEEDDAPVKWFKDGKEIIPDGKRIQIVSEGKKRKLIIKNCKLEDAGMITAKTTGDERSAPLGVKREYIYGSNKCCRMGAQ